MARGITDKDHSTLLHTMFTYDFKESFESIAWDALRQNRLRATLTALGIVIGISIVTLMGWASNGLDAAWESTVNILGNDMLYVDKWQWAGGGNWRQTMARKNISIQEAEEFIKRLNTAELSRSHGLAVGSNLVFEDLKASGFTVTGTRATYAQTPAGDVEDGRFLETEDRYRQNVVVIGYGVKKLFFPKTDPVGRTIKLNGVQYQIIGVIAKRGSALMDFVDNQVFIPLILLTKLHVAMRVVRGLRPEDENDFSINETQMFRDQVAKLRVVIWGVGLFLTMMSFFVGMIGIMNVMLVSVTERTREIGIRKAIGATRRSILLQFLLEAAMLCVAGAIAAILICMVLALAIYLLFHEKLPFLTPYVPPQILVISIVVSVAVGVLAGLFPAMRAASMNPVEALRYE